MYFVQGVKGVYFSRGGGYFIFVEPRVSSSPLPSTYINGDTEDTAEPSSARISS